MKFPHEQGGDRYQYHSGSNQETAVHLPGQNPHQRRQDQHTQALRSSRQSADVGGVSHETSRHERLQVHDAEQEKKSDGDENGAEHKVPIGEDPQIRERFAGFEFPHDKRDQRDDGNHRERANKIGVEPVFILPLVQNGLQRAQPNRQDKEAKSIEPSSFSIADVFRVEDELLDHPQGDQTARDVDVEYPAPGIIVGEPSAQDRPQHGCQDNAHHVYRHGHAPLGRRETLQQNGLRNGLQRAAACALHNGRKNQEGEIWRQAASQRCHGENADADQEEPLAPEQCGKPCAGGQDDGIRDEIARLDPRRLGYRGRKVARYVLQRDADDRGIELLDEGRQNHRERNQPRIDLRLVGFTAHKRKVSGLTKRFEIF